METYERVVSALADSTRRAIVTTLREQPRSVAELADRLPVSRPAVSQHLKVLRDSGLVAYDSSGTRNVYRLDPHGLLALREWLDAFWTVGLDRYAALAQDTVLADKAESGRGSEREDHS